MQSESIGPPASASLDLIRKATVELVGTRGYEATTVEEIVARAGVERPQFDAHFAGKAECYLATFEQLRQQYVELNVAAFAEASDWLDGLRRTSHRAYEFFRQDPVRARFMVIESLNAGDHSAALIDATLELLAELVHAGRFELDDPDSVPRSAAEAAVGSIWNMLATRIREDSYPPEDEIVPQLLFFAIMPYRGAEAAREELARMQRTPAV